MGRGRVAAQCSRRIDDDAHMTAADRHVDVFELARSGGRIAGSVSPGALQRLAAAVTRIESPLEYGLEGFVDGSGRPAARLHVRGRLIMPCDRCNGPLDSPLETRATFFFVTDEAELNAVPIDESEVDALVGSARFDVWNLVEDEAILALPLSPRHDACRPEVAEEPPSEAARPSPFAVLEQLKARKH
jgi:uncharacterized protein